MIYLKVDFDEDDLNVIFSHSRFTGESVEISVVAADIQKNYCRKSKFGSRGTMNSYYSTQVPEFVILAPENGNIIGILKVCANHVYF